MHNQSIIVGACLLTLIVALGLAAPLISRSDPNTINPSQRNLPVGTVSEVVENGIKGTVKHWCGTDSLGRDVFSRILYGIRTSIAIGIVVSFLSVAIGLFLGLLSGSVRWLDMVIMRTMDSMMAVPAILLAMAIVSLFRSGMVSVTLALVVPEVPRVTRLVRSVVLTVREEEYVQAARTLGTGPVKTVMLHIFPNTIPPVIVQGTFICASAMLIEAVLSFLGIGIPPETPTLGNIMAEGRQLFRLLPGLIFLPASALAIMIFAINLMGDGLRDNLDRRLKDH